MIVVDSNAIAYWYIPVAEIHPSGARANGAMTLTQATKLQLYAEDLMKTVNFTWTPTKCLNSPRAVAVLPMTLTKRADSSLLFLGAMTLLRPVLPNV
jgi:hypothetical protein